MLALCRAMRCRAISYQVSMKTYVITLSQVFPQTHVRAGEPTGFRDKFLAAIKKQLGECLKIHTIRANYELWAKRIAEIQAGKAVLSVRQWTGKPYRSKQQEIARLTAGDGVGIQRLDFSQATLLTAWIDFGKRRLSCPLEGLANNDGLSLKDWREWFIGYDLSKPLAIIHFTSYRY